MQSTLYICPVTAQPVYDRMADAVSSEAEDVYVSVLCPACQRVHLVQPRSGRIVGAGLVAPAAVARHAARLGA